MRHLSIVMLAALPLAIATAATVPNGERLKDLAPPGFLVGMMNSGYLSQEWDDASYTALNEREGNAIQFSDVQTWALQYEKGVWNYSGFDREIAYATQKNLPTYCHALIYPHVNKDIAWWQALPNNQVQTEVYRIIDNLATRHKGKIWCWDVVNEAFGDASDTKDAAGLRTTYKEYQGMGASYIAKSFRRARAADPAALLMINDYGCEEIGTKSNNLYNYVKNQRSAGVPIDVVGFQFHINSVPGYSPNVASIRDNFRRFADLGVRLVITELDVQAKWTTRGDDWPTPTEKEQQKSIYKQVFQLALAEPACDGVFIFGLSDRHSWLHPGGDGKYSFPTPFWGDDSPKEAYYGIQEALAEWNGRVRITSQWGSNGALNRDGVSDGNGGWTPSGLSLQPLTAGWAQSWVMTRVGPGRYALANEWGLANGWFARNGWQDASGTWHPGSGYYLDSDHRSWSNFQFQAERPDRNKPAVVTLRNGWTENDSGYLIRTSDTGNTFWFGNSDPAGLAPRWRIDRLR